MPVQVLQAVKTARRAALRRKAHANACSGERPRSARQGCRIARACRAAAAPAPRRCRPPPPSAPARRYRPATSQTPAPHRRQDRCRGRGGRLARHRVAHLVLDPLAPAGQHLSRRRNAAKALSVRSPVDGCREVSLSGEFAVRGHVPLRPSRKPLAAAGQPAARRREPGCGADAGGRNGAGTGFAAALTPMRE